MNKARPIDPSSPETDAQRDALVGQALKKANDSKGFPQRPWHRDPDEDPFAAGMAWGIRGGLSDEELIALWSECLESRPDSESLLRQPLFLDPSTGELRDPFCLAITERREPLALWMLARGANPNAALVCGDGETVDPSFQIALLKGLKDTALALCRHPDFDHNARDSFGRPALNFVGYYEGESKPEVFEALAEALVSGGADINFQDPDGDTPLHSAAAYGEWPLIEALLRRGADPLMLNNEGETAAESSGDPAMPERMRAFALAVEERAALEAGSAGPRKSAARPGL